MTGIALIASLIISGFSTVKQQTENAYWEHSKEFKLSYMICGMGSNSYSNFPAIRVRGNSFEYTSEQNGMMDKSAKRSKPILICAGNLRHSAVDSIIAIVNTSQELYQYSTNEGIMSGTINYLIVEIEGVKHEFTMHNAGNPIAKQVVDILNSHIPADKEKMWVWDDENN